MDDATITQLKQEWTGKQVAIDPSAPSNRRFSGRIGTVVTINMNGRALVRFADTLDTAWFDLPIEVLSVVAPATDEVYPPPAPPADEAGTAEELPPQQADESDRSPPAPAVRPSTATILEMARRQGAGGEKKAE